MKLTSEQRTLRDQWKAVEREGRANDRATRPKVAPKPKMPRNTAKPKNGRERDFGFLTWLHEDLPCIACLIEGRAYDPHRGTASGAAGYRMEAAHQKHTDLKGAALGRRPSDSATCPLCAWHHRLAPNCCDPAQAKFWDRLQVNVGDFCRALFDAYRAGQPGEPVIRDFAARANALSHTD